jgi:6,7-dimethyl-8-ribityllumazine synthase
MLLHFFSKECFSLAFPKKGKMDHQIKGLQKLEETLNGQGLNVLIVKTRWNPKVVNSLAKKAAEILIESKAKVTVFDVAGAFELPFACQQLLKTGKYDACIAIGVLIKGATMHFEYIADATSHGLMRVGLDLGVPVIFGVLTCLTEQQACVRAGIGADSHNHGADWAETAIQQALLVREAK